MNEQSNDLLAAFENPDMVQEPVVQETPVENVAPAAPTAQPQTVVDPSAVMPQEFQNAPEPTPVATPVAPAPAENVAPAAPTPEVAPEAPVDNQNVMPNVSEDPVVSVSQEAKKEEPKDEPSIKKNIIFIVIFCVVIAAFIIFLPKIMELLGGSF